MFPHGIALLSRVPDVSVVNGGAIDGFSHAFVHVAHALGLLAVGVLCARHLRRDARTGQLVYAAAFAIGAALALAGAALPAMEPVTLALAAALVIAAIAGRRLPAPAAWALIAAFGASYANGQLAAANGRDATYTVSYLATFAIAGIGLPWIGMAGAVAIAGPARAEAWPALKGRDAGMLFVGLIGLTAWAAGLVDLVSYTLRQGLASRAFIPLVLVLALYIPLLGLWAALVLRPGAAQVARRLIARAQDRAWLGLLIVAVAALVLVSMLITPAWARLPTLEMAMVITAILIPATVLFARNQPHARVHSWRKVVLAAAGIWAVAELGMQVAAAAGALPLTNMSGAHTAYGRIYQNREGLANATTNRYGWYYPEFKPQPGQRPIILTGDTFVQGLQVRPDQNVGVALERQLAETGADARVLSLGFPGYTAALYADPVLAPYSMLQFNPREVVVFFHLANDLQAGDAPDGRIPYYALNPDGTATVAEQDKVQLHSLQHLVIRAYDPVNPMQSLQSQLFSLQALKRLIGVNFEYRQFGDLGVPPEYPVNTDTVSDEAPFGRSTFAFERSGNAKADAAFGVTRAQLSALKAQLDQLGIGLRVVSIPYFPRGFFQQAGPQWTAQLGEHDALRPEAALRDIARDIGVPFLPMGEYMRARGLTPEQIQALYFNGGAGRFTPEGHAFFARAARDCFYVADGNCPLDLAAEPSAGGAAP